LALFQSGWRNGSPSRSDQIARSLSRRSRQGSSRVGAARRERRGRVDRDAADDDARPGHDVDLDARQAGGAVASRHLDAGIEVALGLEQRARLRRRGRGEPLELGRRDRFARRRALEARQVEVVEQQLSQRARRAHLELVERDLGLGRGAPSASASLPKKGRLAHPASRDTSMSIDSIRADAARAFISPAVAWLLRARAG
jgi:hypothetical protein